METARGSDDGGEEHIGTTEDKTRANITRPHDDQGSPV